jgi:hypothetical protein
MLIVNQKTKYHFCIMKTPCYSGFSWTLSISTHNIYKQYKPNQYTKQNQKQWEQNIKPPSPPKPKTAITQAPGKNTSPSSPCARPRSIAAPSSPSWSSVSAHRPIRKTAWNGSSWTTAPTRSRISWNSKPPI